MKNEMKILVNEFQAKCLREKIKELETTLEYLKEGIE